MPSIELESVTKTFNSPGGSPIRALDDVDLVVEPGEFVSIVGPSGSGKSTLLYTIGGMQRPTEGRILLGETDIYGLSSAALAKVRRERVGFVFQTFNLIPFLSCVENAALPAILAGRPSRQSHARASEGLDRLGLGHRLKHRPGRLSVGERQRVALVRSLINQPEILLADEPTGNLDPETTSDVMNMLLELNRDGQTIVMVTHDLQLARQSTREVRLITGTVANVDSVTEDAA